MVKTAKELTMPSYPLTDTLRKLRAGIDAGQIDRDEAIRQLLAAYSLTEQGAAELLDNGIHLR